MNLERSNQFRLGNRSCSPEVSSKLTNMHFRVQSKQAYKTETQEGFYILFETFEPPGDWKQSEPVDHWLRNGSWKNHVILAHGKGSDYSVMSPGQECHDISGLQLVKPVSSHHLAFRREGVREVGSEVGPSAILGQAFSPVHKCFSTNTHTVDLCDFSCAWQQTRRLGTGSWQRWGLCLLVSRDGRVHKWGRLGPGAWLWLHVPPEVSRNNIEAGLGTRTIVISSPSSCAHRDLLKIPGHNTLLLCSETRQQGRSGPSKYQPTTQKHNSFPFLTLFIVK